MCEVKRSLGGIGWQAWVGMSRGQQTEAEQWWAGYG